MEYRPEVWQGKIQHLDIDNFHISVEELYDPRLKKVPAATYRPHGPITSANALAKKNGIKAAIRIEEAKKREPNLVLVSEHHDRYAKSSTSFYRFLENQNNKVESYSPDEAFLDWSEFSVSEDVEKAKRTLESARKELRLRISSCLAPNRFLAKMGTNLAKPNGFLSLPLNSPEKAVKVFWFLPVEEFYGIGEKYGQKLRKAGFETIGDLGSAPLANLTGPFGLAEGTKLYYLSRGIDILPFPWVSEGPRKSISHQLGPYELDPDKKRTYFLDFDEIKFGLKLLSQKIAKEMEEENYQGKTISAGLRFKENQEWISKQRGVRPYFQDEEVIIEVIEELLPQLFTQKVIDRIGLRVSNLQKDRSQLRLL